MTAEIDDVRRRWVITDRIGRLAARELVLSAVFLVVSVMLIGSVAGWTYWELIVSAGSAIVRAPAGWGPPAAGFVLGGSLAALICFVTALRFRSVTKHFRPIAAVVGNVITAVGALCWSALYFVTWDIALWIVAAAVLGVGAFWLSLLPLSDRVTPPDPTRGELP